MTSSSTSDSSNDSSSFSERSGYNDNDGDDSNEDESLNPSQVSTFEGKTNLQCHHPKPHLYEQLGAPTILYRHHPSYQSACSGSSNNSNNTNVKIPANVIGVSNQNILMKKHGITNTSSSTTSVASSSLSGHHLDIHPPQPWNRKESSIATKAVGKSSTKTSNSNSNIVADANHCVDMIRRANRTRIKTYFQSSLKFQMHDRRNNNHINATMGTDYYDHFDDNDSTTILQQFPLFNNEAPINKNHYLQQKNKYDSSSFSSSSSSSSKDNISHKDYIYHLLLASFYRKQRMESSPLDSYCSPFSIQAVRYGFMPCDFDDDNDDDDVRNDDGSNTDGNDNVESNDDNNNDDMSSTIQSGKSLSSHQDHQSDQSIDSTHNSDNEDDQERNRDKMELLEYPSDDNDNDDVEDYIESDNKTQGNRVKPKEDDDEDYIESDDETVKASAYTLKRKKVKRKKKRLKLTHGQTKQVHECIQYYGNSLVLIPCTCKACLHSIFKTNHHKYDRDNDDNINQKNETGPNFFLLHPTGESISLSFLNLPYGRKRKLQADSNNSKGNLVQVDVGGKVLQVDSCLNISRVVKYHYSMFDDKDFAWTFVVRTALHCSIVRVKMKERPMTENAIVMKNEHINKDQVHEFCAGEYEITETHRISLSTNEDKVYYEFLHLATHHQSGSWYGACYRNFAIVSSAVDRGSEHYHHFKRETNIIHNVQINNEDTHVHKHCIDNLKDIAHIEYSGNHPMVLWAAARSKTNPSLYIGKGSFRRPMLGYGHSLYNIDLRCDRATFMWTPSFEEFMMDGIHSVSGILPDISNPYTLYVKSLSAGGRLYELDSRMASRAVFTWGLPGLADDFKSRLSSEGLYGAGVLMTQPLDVLDFSSEIQMPILTVNQSPAAFGVQLYQRPFNTPRFRTRNLEAPMMSGLGLKLNGDVQRDTSCYATGSSYPVFESSNLKGLVAFYVNSDQIQQKLDNIGYHDYPEKALCIITENSMGDLHAQTLLALSHTETKQAKIVIGNKVGSCAVEIPFSHDREDQTNGNRVSKAGEIYWRVSNNFPSDSRSVLKQHISSRTQCRQFESIDLKHLPHRTKNENTRSHGIDRNISFAHPLPSTQLGERKVNQPLKLNAKFAMDIEKPPNAIEEVLERSLPDISLANHSRIDLNNESLKTLRAAWALENNESLT